MSATTNGNIKNIFIGKAKNDDLLQIAKLDRSAWGNEDIDKYIPDGEHTWRLWMNYSLVYCCHRDGEVIGVALAFLTLDDLFAVHKIFVARKYRKLGYGGMLFNKLIDKMDSLKKDSFLTVSPDNQNAISLYLNKGYQQNKLIKNFYRKDEDRIIMLRKYQ